MSTVSQVEAVVVPKFGDIKVLDTEYRRWRLAYNGGSLTDYVS